MLFIDKDQATRVHNIMRRDEFPAKPLAQQLSYCCAGCPGSHYKQEVVFSTNDRHNRYLERLAEPRQLSGVHSVVLLDGAVRDIAGGAGCSGSEGRPRKRRRSTASSVSTASISCT